MGCTPSIDKKEQKRIVKANSYKQKINENIETNRDIIKENTRMLKMVTRQIEFSNCESSKTRLIHTKERLEKEINEVNMHTDILRQYSDIANSTVEAAT